MSNLNLGISMAILVLFFIIIGDTIIIKIYIQLLINLGIFIR